MAPTIFLHIGAHKTGTSSVQAFLDGHRAQLAEAGWLYPLASRTRFGHHRLGMACRGGGRRRLAVPTTLAAEVAELRAEIEAAGLARVILSSEAFFAIRPRAIEALARAFEGYRLVAVALVRRPDDHLMSIYSQRVKQPKSDHVVRIDDLLADPTALSHNLRPVDAIAGWTDVLGRDAVRVACYEAHPDAVSNVLGLIGLDAPAILGLPRERRNVGLSAPSVELLRRAKLLGVGRRSLRLLQNAASRHLVGPAFAGALLSPEQRLGVLRACDAASAQLFDRFLAGANIYDSRSVDAAALPARRTLAREDIEALLHGVCRDFGEPVGTPGAEADIIRRIVTMLERHDDAEERAFDASDTAVEVAD